MKKRVNVTRRLAIGFASLVVVLCCVGGVTSIVMRQADRATFDISHAYLPELKVATAFEREVLNARINFIYHVTIQKPGTLEKGWERFHNAQALMPTLQEMSQKPQLPELRSATEQLGRDLKEYDRQLRTILECVKTGHNRGDAYVGVLNEWARLGNKMVDSAAGLEKDAATLAGDESIRQSEQLKRTVSLTLGGCVLAILLAVVIAVSLTRGIRRVLTRSIGALRQAIRTIADASQQVAESSRSLGQGATEQAAAVEQTSASCQEISSMARQSSDGGRLMLERMKHSEHASESGLTALEQMLASVTEVTAASESVSKIIKVIDEIAFQTNILALNAAVEAARAGDAGMGFAVVADEVRNLAQRSAAAAKETSDLIGRSVQVTAASRTQVDRVASIMREVAAAAVAAKNIAEQVGSSSAQQTAGLEHMATAMTQIETVTQRVAAGAEETSAAATEIASEARSMNDIAADLASLIGK